MYKVNITNCEKVFLLYNNRLKNKWYGMNSTSNFGTMTYLYKKYGSPTNYLLFYESYVTDKEEGDSRTHGRSEDYIKGLAELLREKDGEKLPLGAYYAYIIRKLIIDTLNGCKWESELKTRLESKGYTTKEPTYKEDAELAIDKFVYKDGKLLFIAQVKPISFFIGNGNSGLINDRVLAFKKELKCKELYNVPVLYFIYDRDRWVTNNKGGYTWKLDSLLTKDGYACN